MFKIKWDEELNGISLTDKTKDNEEINSPRPVFFEELNLLGLNKYWDYPKSREPLLWAIGRRYYYRGIMVAEAKGGNIFEAPSITLSKEGANLQLEPIDIKKVVEKNKKALFVLENEAMDFVEHTYRVYRNKMDFFAVSFSGGKDSQVVLDIVSRILHPEDLIVIFSDTTMEIPFTYEAVEKTKKDYLKRYPNLKFYTTKPPKDALEFWKEFGPPSRIHRWCSTVTKTAPFAKLIKNLYAYQGENKQPAILVFEGVRREESGRRSIYSRLAKGVKHLNIINVRPILDWSLIEVFLYNSLRRLELNKGYRYGLNRVGCSICPFASEWSEYILANIEEDRVNSYITIIEKHANLLGLKNKEKVSKYVADGQWKKRAGGRGLNTNGTSLNFLFNKNQLKAVIRNPREDFSEWLKVAGDVLYNEGGNNKTFGELNIGAEIFPFETETKHGKAIIKFDNIGGDIIAQSKVKRVLYKTTYCIHCGACEVECPTGALKVISEVKINTKLCAHCGNCLNFAQRGCLAAKSIHNNIGGNKMRKKTAGIDKYSTFGMREEWLKSFFIYGNKWLESNNLGNKQVMAMLHWLTDAELIDIKTKEVTQLRIYLKNIQLKEYLFAWAIFWTNIYYNSPVVRWYVNTLDWGGVFTKKELKEKIRQFYPHLSEGTLGNPVDAMVNMFDNSPLGEKMGFGTLEKKGKAVKKIKKLGTDEIHPFAVAYSLYKAAEHIGRRDFTVSELYHKEFEGGPYKLFGISRDKIERILRGLQEDKDQILRVDLVADLDNIYLRDDLTSLDIVKIVEEKTK